MSPVVLFTVKIIEMNVTNKAMAGIMN